MFEGFGRKPEYLFEDEDGTRICFLYESRPGSSKLFMGKGNHLTDEIPVEVDTCRCPCAKIWVTVKLKSGNTELFIDSEIIEESDPFDFMPGVIHEDPEPEVVLVATWNGRRLTVLDPKRIQKTSDGVRIT
ncbi:hypothetical protein [Shimazuella alba]|uniref:Uncharacterized protein n=1 Tax=Shimazuella alba TaxID=2690964 RepID=A0A6I4VMY1_9BACL|nr:hypothetical protein [Shimazuella alba]MXQ52969.1 hypothetical protein [Shimazuella alba]